VPETSGIFYRMVRKGWQPAPIEGGWRLCHPHTQEAVYVALTKEWISLTYPLDILPAGAALFEHYRSLLERNERIFMARFCLDPSARPCLIVDICARCPQSILFERALDALLYAVDTSVRADVLPDDLPGLPRETVFRYIRGIRSARWVLKEEPQGMGQNWHLLFKGRFHVFDVYLTLTRQWVYFQIPILPGRVPPVLQEDSLAARYLFCTYLLRLNEHWFWARLSLSAEGCLLIVLDIPTEALDFPLFHLASETLATYLDRYVQELQTIASLHHDPELTQLLSNAF